MIKPKLLFVYDIPDEQMWKDGLFAAIELLKKDFEITKVNLLGKPWLTLDDYDFVLGWGGFNSLPDKVLRTIPLSEHKAKLGLCLGGYAPYQGQKYDILFYEVPKWSKNWLKEQGYEGKTMHAFGVNTDIYKPHYRDSECKGMNVIWDFLTVGSFAYWKRQDKILQKKGSKMAVGQIQDNNLVESADIIGNLILGHCGVSDSVSPERLAIMYNLSETCYLPADLMGGSERAVLEARACRTKVEVENDNPKLQELLTSPIWDAKYYAKQLKEGIYKCLN
jgi:hypothetical protein